MRQESGMRQSEIEKCAACGRAVGHSNQLVFYQLKARYMMLDIGAIRRADGMEQMMGGGSFGAMIQQVMGRDEDLAKEVFNHSLCICQQCSITHSLAALIEMATNNKTISYPEIEEEGSEKEEEVGVDTEGSDQAS